MIGQTTFYFAQPYWLLAALLAIPIAWLGVRNLRALGRGRRIAAITLRVLVVALLAALLARPMLAEKYEKVTTIAVMDRSQSVPQHLQDSAVQFLLDATRDTMLPDDRLAVVDAAEAAAIAALPGGETKVLHRNTSLTGIQSKLSAGVQIALAIAPPDSGTRILLVSDGNETEGDLAEAARIAAANGIPIDVLPLRYNYDREVIFTRLAAPARARSGQSITLRFILNSTAEARGRLMLNLNHRSVDLDPTSPEIGATVTLQPGTNVKTISIPLGTRGMHEFDAYFIPEDSAQDGIVQNNRAGAMTFVAGPGHVLVLDTDGASGLPIIDALGKAGLDARQGRADDFPQSLPLLMGTDAVVLVNVDNSAFSYQQQEMLCRYVEDLGGGLVMIGGPDSFGAGGWIGSPIAVILPVNLDPPQKKQLPKGALVLIMHACEMPRGNFWGKRTAITAVRALSRLDLVGVIDYAWNSGNSNWVYPLSPVGDKQKVNDAINKMVMGDMPDFHAPVQAAYDKLKACNAAQKHIIIISDGDPSMPTNQLLGKLKDAGITCTGIGIFPHSPADIGSLAHIARSTGGRFYNVKNPNKLPQIFIKEAQVIRRPLIMEKTFTPKITFGLSEILKGVGKLPQLDGYILTGPKGGLTQTVLTSDEGDPILATSQAGLGRCVAFTSSADSRWANDWLNWGGYERFWEQTVRWASKSSHAGDCEVFVDVHGRNVSISAEAVDAKGNFVQLADMVGQVISPALEKTVLPLSQVGPGLYRSNFRADSPGSYLVNLKYRTLGKDGKERMIQTAVTVPHAAEFRDLTDNASLLAEVARLTGGRILQSDPLDAGVFSKVGLKFPEKTQPLTQLLIFIWLGLFLLDVAVRRVAVDFRAMFRKLIAAIKFRKTAHAADKTLSQLQERRNKLKETMTSAADRGNIGKRFDAGDQPAEGELEIISTTHPDKPAAKKQADEKVNKKSEAVEESSHLQQLLKAKRKSADRYKKDK